MVIRDGTRPLGRSVGGDGAADGGASVHEVAVPVAFADDGALVRPDQAVPDRAYRCPGCGAPLVLRRGSRRRPHFAHRGGDGCSTESTLHRAAKHQLIRVIQEWKGGGPRPCVSRPCPTYACEGGVVQDVPDDVTHAEAEVRLAEGVIADVVLFRGDVPAAAIEILVTHRVGAEKARRLEVPWMELRAADVLERPYWWLAEQDGLQPFECPACLKRRSGQVRLSREIHDAAIALASQISVSLPPSPPYHYAPHSCWRCASRMVVFLWPGGGDHSPRRPPSPIPATVQHRVTDGGGDYWANCCPNCSAVQGDYYLESDNEQYRLMRELSQELIGHS